MADSDVGGNFWGSLVNTNDKTAAPLLQQLCLGLARVISTLAKGPENKLTPEQLAAFYRSVDGQFDSLFLGGNDASPGNGSRFNAGLSFMYRLLGCFHSLEPTYNAFETPCVPCLTPEGFVRWVTVQLLLCPDEHALYLQKAVQKYDVKRSDGRLFSKTIPRDAFPEVPDPAFEKWHNDITSKLNHGFMQRRKNSPHSSPVPQSHDRHDDYFGRRIPRINKPPRPSRDRSSGEDRRRPRADARRSSVPDFVSPVTSPVDHGRPPSSFQSRDSDRRRSTSVQRVPSSRPRAATAAHPFHQRNSSSSSRHDSYERPSQGPQRQHPPYSRHHSNSKFQAARADDDPSGEEASSEDSVSSQRRKRYDSSPRGDFKQRALLMPVSSAFSTKRRHSHDAGAMRRDDQQARDGPRSSRLSPGEPSIRSPHTVHFREDVFEDRPASPMADVRFPTGRRSDTFPRSVAGGDDQNRYRTAKDFGSGDSSDRYQRDSRSKDLPTRVSTVTGVGGRRYANAEPKSPARQSGAESQQRDGRQRYSVAV